MTIGGPRHKNSPPPGSKRVGDWKGMRVRSLVEMTNGMGSLPAGTAYTVQGTTLGLSLVSDPCPTCGGKQHITRVQSKDVEPAPAQAPAPAAISDERILALADQFKNDPIGFAHAVLAERAAPASTDWSQSEEAQRLKVIADEFRNAIPTENGLVLAAMIEQGVTVLDSYIRYAFNIRDASNAPKAPSDADLARATMMLMERQGVLKLVWGDMAALSQNGRT